MAERPGMANLTDKYGATSGAPWLYQVVGEPDVATKVTGSQHELGFRAFDEKSRGKARRFVLAM
jgi:hypothetical protein